MPNGKQRICFAIWALLENLNTRYSTYYLKNQVYSKFNIKTYQLACMKNGGMIIRNKIPL